MALHAGHPVLHPLSGRLTSMDIEQCSCPCCAGLKVPESQKMQELLAELKRIERQQSVLQDAVQNSKTVIAHPRVTATPPDSPEKPKEPEDKFIASGERWGICSALAHAAPQ